MYASSNAASKCQPAGLGIKHKPPAQTLAFCRRSIQLIPAADGLDQHRQVAHRVRCIVVISGDLDRHPAVAVHLVTTCICSNPPVPACSAQKDKAHFPAIQRELGIDYQDMVRLRRGWGGGWDSRCVGSQAGKWAAVRMGTCWISQRLSGANWSGGCPNVPGAHSSRPFSTHPAAALLR